MNKISVYLHIIHLVYLSCLFIIANLDDWLTVQFCIITNLMNKIPVYLHYM